MFNCKYCGKAFEKSYQLAAHVSMCDLNTNSNRRFKKYISISQRCLGCSTEFSIEVSESDYTSGRYRKYCCRSCSNKRTPSEESKIKISTSLKNHYISEVKKDTGLVINTCKCCDKKFYSSKHRKFCSDECSKKGIKLICEQCENIFFNSKFRKFCTKECKDIANHELLVKAGKKSASIQAEDRRSKNEKLFCSFCEKTFSKVEHNIPLFNGWDADILIHDLKIAVLWNGPWHYKKITKKHSVNQVQNRDKIKISEIEKAGWKCYVIKDLGKFNKKFVEKQFKLFQDSINTNN